MFTLFGWMSIPGCVALAQTPVINPGGVVNPAGLGNTTTIGLGSLISIFCSGLASALAQASSAILSTTLGDVNSVTINGVAAPLKFVSAGQINAQAPWETIPRDGTCWQPRDTRSERETDGAGNEAWRLSVIDGAGSLAFLRGASVIRRRKELS
jgi:hypothetical protein